ncbi:hypothetical protein QBC32DRAFT_48985 [Pseudoneurospora amorphoporcata]|uniref:Nephrocystin 3-like N-terminal domain-containing protein n=1 Tax=Pseudoneurospora amorphoporcata TaxID=241081 RepID=A0AAN6NND5_9PEZI|nr:hypothetical protein QBC32DRAFT_48985 [Pseudoneurospora amorphoporcata]
MKLLVRDERTRHELSNWTDDPIILLHFLWISGTKDQRSMHKVLCSLLYQPLEQGDGLVDQLTLQFSFLDHRSHVDEWSKTELRQVLWEAIRNLDKRICIFLNGLDEVDGEDRVEFHRFIKDLLQAQPEIKLCVASRPEVPLERIAGRVCPKFRLQDLTRIDISMAVRDFLRDFSLSDTGINANKNEAICDEIINLVIDRSEGVFLWVHLVLRRIHNGRETIGSLDEVLRRIEKLPKGVICTTRHGKDAAKMRKTTVRRRRITFSW